MLQKWADDTESFSIEDERAFADMAISGGGAGNGTSKGGWDQFAANEARFGVKSNYEETLYTTKLDKTAKDFKERERKADQLAREIMNVSQRAKMMQKASFTHQYYSYSRLPRIPTLPKSAISTRKAKKARPKRIDMVPSCVDQMPIYHPQHVERQQWQQQLAFKAQSRLMALHGKTKQMVLQFPSSLVLLQ